MITHMFHGYIPNYTFPTVSHLDSRQRSNPNNVETQRLANVGAGLLAVRAAGTREVAGASAFEPDTGHAGMLADCIDGRSTSVSPDAGCAGT